MSAGPAAPAARIHGVDSARGIVMLLMVVDHVRVYAGVPAGGADAPTFLTRWITHFCAPWFLFLAGTSVFLHGQGKAVGTVSRRLLWRGLWLVLLELTVLKVAWTFQLDYGSVLAGVIWVIGWSMVLLAGLVWLPVAAVGSIGLAIVLGHNLVGPWFAAPPGARPGAVQTLLWGIGGFKIGAGPVVLVLYSLVPWIGVMACGYAFGALLTAADRARRCVVIGSAAIAAFVLLRSTGLYGDPRPWPANGDSTPAWLQFLGTTKYPASLLFLSMTLGPLLVLLPLFERWRGRTGGWVATFGRAPMLFYLLHIPLVHLLAVGVALVRTPDHLGWLFANHPMASPPVPPDYRWSLPLLYAVTALAVAMLYWPCLWWDRQRREHPRWWHRLM